MKGRYSMKRFVAVLSGLLVLPAFADTVRDTVQPIAQPSSVASRSGATGRGAARVSPSARGSSDPSARNVNARTVATSRNATQARTGVKNREATTTSPRTATTNNARVAQRTATTARTATKGAPVATTVRRNTTNNSTTNTGRAAITNARAGVRSGVMARAGSVATTATTNTADQATTISQMDSLTQMTDYCKAQYTSCMDNYCNVLDDNQGRCTCSKNIKNYEKTEKALKEANEALQDVAQQIQYIGLTADEIETLFSQTEAEIQMQATTDNSQLKNSLDSIRDLIVEVKSGTATSTDTGMSFDLSGLLDFNIGDTGFDLSAIFGSNNTNTNSISNQRGEQLYKTASTRCKASVLNTCQNQGVDISVITNAYDMEIDKQCIAYERSLNEANDNMNNTVRNAKTVLQKARLMVSQQKNSYDLRGCVNALDSCMQDEFVCGSDYENCLDPTGKYIVNGEIVAGSMPGLAVESTSIDAPTSDLTQSGLYKTWNYDDGDTEVNAWNNDGSLAEYINATVKKNTKPSDTSSIMSEYLMAKIGYIDGNRNYGMCSAVLNKCQMYTFDDNGAYQHDNMVVKEYLARTMTQIKAAQDEILADYAGNCMVDIETCLGKNNYGTNNGTYSNAAINACRSQIITCMSVNGDATKEPNPAAIKAWIDMAYNETAQNCESTGGEWSSNTCDCSGTGKIANTNGKCVTQAEYNCTSTGGTYTNGTCTCGTGYESDGAGGCTISQPKCVAITLDPNDGTLSRYNTLYAKVGATGLYTDSSCSTATNSGNFYHYNSQKTSYTFNGYYTSKSGGTQCTDNQIRTSSCSITGTTTWYAQYTKQEPETPSEPEQCIMINLVVGTGSGGTQTVYKSSVDSTVLYTDAACTDSSLYITGPTPETGFTFDGYYSANDFKTQCIDHQGKLVTANITECNPTSATKWYGKYTPDTPTEPCVPITLKHTNSDGTELSGGKSGTIHYKNSQLYTEETCSTKLDTSRFTGMLSSINPGSDYTYKYVEDAVSGTTCITNPYAYVQDTDCQPTTSTTWNVVWTPSSFTVNFVLPTYYTVNYVSTPNTTATIGQTFKLPDSQNLTIVTPNTTYNIDNDCSNKAYWCYKSNSTGTSKCFYTNQNISTNWMTATDVQDLYNSGKTMYFSLADTYDTCYELYETLGIQPIWHNDGYCYVTGIQEAEIWCDAN